MPMLRIILMKMLKTERLTVKFNGECAGTLSLTPDK